MKKRFFSFLLALAILFSVTPAVFAAEIAQIFTLTFDNATPHAGDKITATIYLDQTPVDYYKVTTTLSYNKDFLTYESYTCSWEDMTCTVREKTSGEIRSKVDFKIDSNRGTDTDILNKIRTRQTGAFATVTFKVNESCEVGQAINYQFIGSFYNVNAMAAINNVSVTGSLVVNEQGGSTITVPKTKTGYTVSMGADQQLTAGQRVRIPVTVASSEKDITGFNAYDMTFTYDPEALTLNTKSGDVSGMTLEDTNGTIRVRRYGEAMELGEALTLDFTAKETAISTVRLTSARFDLEINSINFDAPEATITDADTLVDANNFIVTLPDEFTSDAETRMVVKGGSFTFKPVDKNYDYTFTVEMGDSISEDLTFASNNTYTIGDITDHVTVHCTGKTPKKVKVRYSFWYEKELGGGLKRVEELSEVIKGPDEVAYGEEYSFAIRPVFRRAYYASVRGDAGTLNLVQRANADGTVTYTVKNLFSSEDLVIKINAHEFTSYNVVFDGNGTEDLAPNTTYYVGKGKLPYYFELNKRENCDYTVTALYGQPRMPCTVTEYEDGKYMVEGNGPLYITVTKVSHSVEEVDVSPYLELNDKTLMLVAVKGALESGKAYTYDGNTMYKIQNHGSYGMNMQAWLVLVDKGQTLTQEEAAAKVEISAADSVVTIDASGDVNMTGTVDVNDVQFIYDMYNGVYNDFSQASVENFLRADVNGSKNLDHADAVAAVSQFEVWWKLPT